MWEAREVCEKEQMGCVGGKGAGQVKESGTAGGGVGEI